MAFFLNRLRTTPTCAPVPAQVLLIRGQEVQRDSSRKNEISSRFMTSAHTLVFNHEGEFLPYVTKQCVVQTTTGEPEYDFENAEKFLIARQNCPPPPSRRFFPVPWYLL